MVVVLVVVTVVLVVVVVTVVLEVAVVVVVAIKALVWTEASIDMLVEVLAIDVRIDGLIGVVDAVAITVGFEVPVSCSVDVLSDVPLNVLAGVLTAIRIGGLPDI